MIVRIRTVMAIARSWCNVCPPRFFFLLSCPKSKLILQALLKEKNAVFREVIGGEFDSPQSSAASICYLAPTPYPHYIATQ